MSTNKLELIKGQLYNIRLTDGHWTKGEFQGIRETNWLQSRTVKRYMFRNVLTGRDVELKSMARIKDVEGTPLKPEDTDAYNKALEAKELDWFRTGPDKCVLHIQRPDLTCKEHRSNTDNKNNMYFGVGTWLGTRVGNAWVGSRAYTGFQGYFRAYRRPVTVRIFGTLYHGWWFESSGDYVRLKKAKRQDTIYAATHRNGN